MSAYIIAEIGVNHNGDMNLARCMIDEAARAGCDAVKFQTFKTERLVTGRAEKAQYQIENTGSEESQFEMLKRLELDSEQFAELKTHCECAGIEFLSTPFDEDSVDLLEGLGMTRYKVSSGDMTNKPLVEYIAKTGKPMIVSTGMADLGEISEMLDWIRDVGSVPVTLLHCTSNYPTAYNEVDMLAMQTLSDTFGCPVGYSDHTIGCEIPVMAVALGAEVIEKHITLDRTMDGPDHRASLETKDLGALVSMIRHVESAFGDPRKRTRPVERQTAVVARKSVVAVRSLHVGDVVARLDIAVKRPGTGIAPQYFDDVIGRVVARDVEADTPLTEQDFQA